VSRLLDTWVAIASRGGGFGVSISPPLYGKAVGHAE
jgi:hypothetical protein